MTIAYKTNALWVCTRYRAGGAVFASDGDEGPEDGVNDFHPEHAFHQDFLVAFFPRCDL
jgi:hypothetical protein